ncbi:tyrosine-type recombinase/integrase [Photobacterium leiognathi]|uniref:tyrosine-type recombinase/integrase n=1 Tax=Photobacterium leiognathi TaxID=553611 RepID=UPI000D177A26|nr:tyrosine-type recombinase/integrase [Photobacterium leiognathi]PSW44404.1 hypothetical protein C0W40_09320 [Photobacterium leiognathi subsp. mandapamensis]
MSKSNFHFHSSSREVTTQGHYKSNQDADDIRFHLDNQSNNSLSISRNKANSQLTNTNRNPLGNVLTPTIRIYFTTIKKIYTYYIRMTLRSPNDNQSVTVSLRTNKRAIAMTNAKILKEHMYDLSGTFIDFDHMRQTLKDIAKDLLSGDNHRDIKVEWFNKGVYDCTRKVVHCDSHLSLSVCTSPNDSSLNDVPNAITSPIESYASIETNAIDAPIALTISGLVEAYINDKKSNGEWSEYTSIYKSSALRSIVKVFKEANLSDKPIADITRNDLIDGVRSLLTTTLMTSTVNSRMRDIKSLFKFAELNDYVSKSVANKLEIKDKTKKTPKDLPSETIMSIIQYASTGHRERRKTANPKPYNEYLHWFVQLGSITGARLNELAQLRKSDVIQCIDSSSSVYYISINDEQEGNCTKNAASNRCVPLVDGAYGFNLDSFIKEVVDTCSNDDDFIFRLDSVADRNNFTASVNQVFVKYKKVNPQDTIAIDRKASMHSLRHTMATLCLNKKMPEAWTQRLLGHTQGITYGLYGSGGINGDNAMVEMHSELQKVLL